MDRGEPLRLHGLRREMPEKGIINLHFMWALGYNKMKKAFIHHFTSKYDMMS